jgi:sialic acid synthase SpsE
MIHEIFGGRTCIHIAEIGLNHNGNPDTAIEMVGEAARAGAAGVKFQTFNPGLMNSVYSSSLLKTGKEGIPSPAEKEFFSKYTLSPDDYRKVISEAKRCKVEFFSSPFDEESVDFLESLDVRLYKIASSEVTNHILLRKIAQTGKPVILSTGISREDEIASAIEVLSGGCPEIVLMHCVSLYPVPDESLNLNRIISLRERFGLETGFSDHSPDSRPAEYAAALGARIFEKHFTLSPDFDCPDKSVSLSPADFSAMIQSVERVLRSLGDGRIGFSDKEGEVARAARKSLFAARDIPAGAVLTAEDVVPKRPGTGIPVYSLNGLIGRRARIDIPKDYLIRTEYFE